MTSLSELLRTQLYDWHVSHGGRMVDFAGWSMPVQYKSIAEEHNATRTAVGVFDISHMGRLQFKSDQACLFLDRLVTRRISDLAPNQIKYGLVCKEDGGILDDVLVYRDSRHGVYTMVVNASNRDKIVEWIKKRLAAMPNGRGDNTGFVFVDQTLQTAMIAVQGPNAVDVLSPFFMMNHAKPRIDLNEIKYYHCRDAHFDQHEVLVSRTGYTGEDGFEIICNNDSAREIWDRTIEAAAKVGGIAAGLGARDTLRLEAAMPLYGHELSETINPIRAGLNFAVNLKDRDFIGRAALEQFAKDKTQPVRIGLSTEGKRVPRQGCPVLHNGEVVGEVTSGTFSPTLERSIAMAYVRPTAAAIGTKLTVDIRGTHCEATVVPLPFYDRKRI